MCTLQEYLDKNIKETWLTEIKEDYTSNFLLGEDSLKCSFYFHLRNRLGEGQNFLYNSSDGLMILFTMASLSFISNKSFFTSSPRIFI